MSAEPVRMQPHSIEAEQAVLGALLIDVKAWPLIAGVLKPTDFYRADHRMIFSGAGELADCGVAIDVVTLSEHLQRNGRLDQAGGTAYLGTLARDTPTAANVEAYADVVRERSVLRRLHTVARQIAKSVHDAGDCTSAELIAEAERLLFELRDTTRVGKGLVPAQHLVSELLADLEFRKERERGLSIGLSDFDALTCGLEGGDLVVIAGRPGMGKTALLVSIASAVSTQAAVAVFSAEMPAQQLTRRALALLSRIPQGKLRRADTMDALDWQALFPAADALAAKRLFIDDTAAPTLAHVRAECAGLRARSGLGLVIVDYVQLMRGAGANRYEQLRDVAYGLKALAKDLAVPVVVLAQLNRGVEAREHKRPHVSDLRDSGAIEEAADIVALLYAEGYYDSQFAMPYVLECAVDKNRNGARGECLWRFAGAQSHVEVLDDGARAQYRQLRAKAERPGFRPEL